MVRWFQSTLAVLCGAAFSADFYQRAARAAVEMLGLDSALVLLRQGESWRVEAQHLARPDQGETPPSQQILTKVLTERRTFWKTLPVRMDGSLHNVQAAVAAPILGRDQEVIGVLYGDRRHDGVGIRRPLTRLEALLAEVLAGGVAAGLARVEMETAARAHQRLARPVFHAPAGSAPDRPGRSVEGPRSGGLGAGLRYPWF